jgi:undecaprenyl diphosphate synthase
LSMNWNTTPSSSPLKHLAIIPDGNRRFGAKTAKTMRDAYLHGARTALEVVSWAIENGIPHLSAFGVSAENIQRRSRNEVRWILEAIDAFCTEASTRADVAMHVFGDVDSLERICAGDLPGLTSPNVSSPHEGPLTVHVGVNYSTRFELNALLRSTDDHGLDAVRSNPLAHIGSAALPPIDLLIRTGGQQRLSGFLPLQASYAELWFTDVLWPDFRRTHFDLALAWYAAQDRRVGE